MTEANQIEIIKSRRKSFSMEIKPDGRVIVRAPLRAPKYMINAFIQKHEAWLSKRLQRLKVSDNEGTASGTLSASELLALKNKAKEIIPLRAAYYASLLGVTYDRITIRQQKTRWGSCSLHGNLNFNCLLLLTPPEVLDSVVVHELCHLKEMNHSRKFYDEVLSIYPDYPKWNQWLKDNGPLIMRRAFG